MKRYITKSNTFIILLLFSLPVFSQTKVYEGTINRKYNIEMHLNFTNKTIHGYYFYKTKHLPIALFGEINGTKVKLVESDLIDTSIFFQGVISEMNIHGHWKDISKKKELNFSLKQIEAIDSNKNYLIKNGDYENKGNSGKYSKYCSIYYIDKNLLYYEFSIANYNCDGQVFGIAQLEKNELAKSLKISNVQGDCSLIFTFSSNKIKVEEKECDSYHGASCTFGGEFINK